MDDQQRRKNTLDYYTEQAQRYIEGTLNADMSGHYVAFLKHIPPQGHLLDAGCGSGRDVTFFLSQGYNVSAFDGSEAMVDFARTYTGVEVLHTTFEDFEAPPKSYDGIWANASLLHLSKSACVPVLKKFYTLLKDSGVLYLSFKYGEEAYEKDGRWFTCQTEESLEALMEDIGQWAVKTIYCTKDVRPGRADETWVNGIFVKV